MSKRRRRKILQDDTSGQDSSGADSKAMESSSKKHSCEKCGRVFSKWKHLSIHYTKVEYGCDERVTGGFWDLYEFSITILCRVISFMELVCILHHVLMFSV